MSLNLLSRIKDSNPCICPCRYKGALCFPVVQGTWEAAENSGCEPYITVSPKNRVHRLGEMTEGRAGPKAWSQP